MNFPDFEPPRWRCISACGIFEGEDKDTTDRIKRLSDRAQGLSDKQWLIKYGDGGRAHLVSLNVGGSNGRHVHLDLAACDCDGSTGNPNSTQEEMNAILEEFDGGMIRVNYTAGFRVPMAELPVGGLILGCNIESSHGVMRVKQSSAGFTIDRGPIDRISWSTADGQPNSIDVGLYLCKVTTFDRDYLTSFYRTADSVFNYLIMGRELNAART